MATVTIGLPIANESLDYVQSAVNSVVNQSYTDWELIVVLDLVSEEVASWLDSLADDRIQIVRNSSRQGLAANLNTITRMTKSKILARMDADDIMSPDRIAAQVAYLDAHVEVDLVFSNATAIDQHDQILGALNCVVPRDIEVCIKATPYIHPTLCGRTEWFVAHPYDETLKRSEDRALWISTFVETTVALIEESLLFYRISFPIPYAKYKQDCETDRHLLGTLEAAQEHPRVTRRVVLKSFSKQIVFKGISLIKPWGPRYLHNKRFQAMPQADAEKAKATLERVTAISV